MARGDWRDREEDRRGWRGDPADREDFGQADYSDDYDYDPRTRRGFRSDDRAGDERLAEEERAYLSDDRRAYRRPDESDLDLARARAREDGYARYRHDNGHDGRRARDEEDRDRRLGREPRSWLDRASDFFAGDSGGRRRGPSDRVIWAVVAERLQRERGLDLSDVELIVRDGEATLNGTVRSKAEKRRIEDIVDMDEVRHIQNNLRVRDRGHWTFL